MFQEVRKSDNLVKRAIYFPLNFPLNCRFRGFTWFNEPEVIQKPECISAAAVSHRNDDASDTWSGGEGQCAPPDPDGRILRCVATLLHPSAASAACDTQRGGIPRLHGSHCCSPSSPAEKNPTWTWWAAQEDEARTWGACWGGTGFWSPRCCPCCSVGASSSPLAFSSDANLWRSSPLLCFRLAPIRLLWV